MVMAEVGVVLLMFSAGLENEPERADENRAHRTRDRLCGSIHSRLEPGRSFIWPCTVLHRGERGFLKAVFVGTIMTATSVSITVQTLREMGRLKGRVGTTILSAAIIDDVIGIIVLTVVIGFKDENSRASTTIISTALFFVFALVIGYVFYRVFKKSTVCIRIHAGFRLQVLRSVWDSRT